MHTTFWLKIRLKFYLKKNIKLKTQKLNILFMSNKVECQDEDYPNSQIGKDIMHALDMIFSKPLISEIKIQLLDYMFIPNKPSMFSPLSKVTKLYLIGLTK